MKRTLVKYVNKSMRVQEFKAWINKWASFWAKMVGVSLFEGEEPEDEKSLKH